VCCKNVINTSQWLTLGKNQSENLGQGDGCYTPEIRDNVSAEDLEESKLVD
jgi:hypothetical protein